jgi:hypothetical protein
MYRSRPCRYRRDVPTLAELAEEPGLWLPDDGLRELVALDGLTATIYGSSFSVERVRLPAGGVDRALADVRELARARRVREVLWWVSGRSRPRDLERLLLERGLVPDPAEPELTTVTLEEPPAGVATVEVRLVETLDDFRRALAIDWDVFDLPQERRAERRAAAREQWRRLSGDERVFHHLALVDDAPVGFGRTVLSPAGGLMLGGAVLPHARGRGVYTSLIHARWREAAARGVPALGTAAGSMSGPILRRLGFAEHGTVRLLLDRL